MAHRFNSGRRCVPFLGSLALASVRHAPAICRTYVALTASPSALYVFGATATGGVTETWRQGYDRGPARKPGQLSWGTGSTPAFFGPDTGFEYLTITDNASPQESILVFDSSDGTPIGSAPFLTAGVNSGTENAPLAVGSSIYLTSTYGYEYPPGAASGPSDPATAAFVGGMQRVDVLAGGAGLKTAWTNQTLTSATLPRFSTGDNLIYTVEVDVASGMDSFMSIDPATGVVLSSTPIGDASVDNTLQMVGTLGPSGVLYQGTEGGLFSVTAVPELSTYAMALAGLACGGYSMWRRRERA